LRTKLLICNNDPGIGKIVADNFNSTTFTVWNCTMHYKDLNRHLSQRDYDVVVFFVGEHSNDTANRIRRLDEKYNTEDKKIDIIVVMVYKWENNKEKYYSEGASLCLWFQDTPAWMLVQYIRLMLFQRKHTEVDSQLSGFLVAHGFGLENKGNKGFRYLCLMLSFFLEEPKRLDSEMQNNCEEIAVRYGDGKGGNVERNIRYYIKKLYKSPYFDPLIKMKFSKRPKMTEFILVMYNYINECIY